MCIDVATVLVEKSFASTCREFLAEDVDELFFGVSSCCRREMLHSSFTVAICKGAEEDMMRFAFADRGERYVC